MPDILGVGLQFGQELLVDVFDEAAPLMELHHAETAQFSDEKLNAGKEYYLQLEAEDRVVCFTVRDLEKKLWGYALYMVQLSPHQGELRSFCDCIFIHPEKRGIGQKFISYCDEFLKGSGIKHTFIAVNSNCDYSRKLLELGYSKAETIYGRRF